MKRSVASAANSRARGEGSRADSSNPSIASLGIGSLRDRIRDAFAPQRADAGVRPGGLDVRPHQDESLPVQIAPAPPLAAGEWMLNPYRKP